jgi:hypothetical protein
MTTSRHADRSTRRQVDGSTGQSVVMKSASWLALRHSTMSMTSP